MNAFARSYARALIESAPRIEDVSALLDQAGAVARAIGSDPRMKEFFGAPGVPREAKQKALDSLAMRAGLDDFGRRFLAVVLANRRLLHLHEILEAAHAELDRVLGVAQAQVRVAAPIGPEDEGRIATALQRSVARQIRIRVAVDESILGGFVARIGSRVIDASVASAIARFRERSKQTAGA